MELSHHRHLNRMYQNRKKQILTPFAFPFIGATATTSRLVIGYDHHIARTVFFYPTISGVCLINMNNFPFHVAKVQKKIVLLHHGREK